MKCKLDVCMKDVNWRTIMFFGLFWKGWTTIMSTCGFFGHHGTNFVNFVIVFYVILDSL